MQQLKLHKWLAAILFITLAASCSRSNYPARSPREDRNEERDMYPGTAELPPGQAKKVYGEQSARVFAPGQRKKMQRNSDYRPPAVIIISDDLASSNRNGELYYDNEYGYRYWRNCDGKYYLDVKYETEDNRSQGKKGKKNKQSKNKKHSEEDDE